MSQVTKRPRTTAPEVADTPASSGSSADLEVRPQPARSRLGFVAGGAGVERAQHTFGVGSRMPHSGSVSRASQPAEAIDLDEGDGVTQQMIQEEAKCEPSPACRSPLRLKTNDLRRARSPYHTGWRMRVADSQRRRRRRRQRFGRSKRRS